MAEIVPSALFPLVFQFLQSSGLSKSAKCFAKEAGQGEVEEGGVSLLDVYKFFVEKNTTEPEKKRKSKKADQDSDVPSKKRKLEEPEPEPAQEAVEEPAPKKKSKKSKVDTPAIEPEPAAPKPEAPAVAEPKKDKKKKKAEPEPAAEEANVDEEPTDDSELNGNEKSNSRPGSRGNTPFRRVIAEEIEVDPRLLDNSFWSKKGDEWGAKANEDLIITRGKGFRHAKTKKKRGSYKGGAVDMGVNSVKFNYSDDE